MRKRPFKEFRSPALARRFISRKRKAPLRRAQRNWPLAGTKEECRWKRGSGGFKMGEKAEEMAPDARGTMRRG